MIRTPREWMERCSECSGKGVVRKREDFVLWTPEEYAEVMPPEFVPEKLDVKHAGLAPANAVVCVAQGGAHLLDACKEAVGLARAFGRPVAFEFNGVLAVCYVGEDARDVMNRWRRSAA